MPNRYPFVPILALASSLVAASPALALANRVFVSARSGNNLSSCDNIATPCQTLAGAIAQLNPDGEAIVLDSGGYGSVSITQGVTIEAPPGVTAFIHPPSGDAITVDAGTAVVTLRGLTLNVGPGTGIAVTSVGILNVENCFISKFLYGIVMSAPGRLNVKGTDISGANTGIVVSNVSGAATVSIDHSHLDANGNGFMAATTSPGSSQTSATYTTANCTVAGWVVGYSSTGKDVATLDSCTGSGGIGDGLLVSSSNAQTTARFSSCVFTNNGGVGVRQQFSGTAQSRGNNTLVGNANGPTSGAVTSFAPM